MNYQRTLELEADAIVATCKTEGCALCPHLAQQFRKWFQLRDDEKAIIARLLANKIRELSRYV